MRLAGHFYRRAAARHHVAARDILAVMTAIAVGVKHDLERALALILGVKHHTSLNPNARLRFNKFQTAIEGLLNTNQISRIEWQVTELFGTSI